MKDRLARAMIKDIDVYCVDSFKRVDEKIKEAEMKRDDLYKTIYDGNRQIAKLDVDIISICKRLEWLEDAFSAIKDKIMQLECNHSNSTIHDSGFEVCDDCGKTIRELSKKEYLLNEISGHIRAIKDIQKEAAEFGVDLNEEEV